MTEDELNNSWSSWGNHVLQTIGKLEKKVDQMEKNQQEYEIKHSNEITAIKAKAGIVGAITGAIGSAIIALIIAISANFATKEIQDVKSEDTTEKEKDVSIFYKDNYKPTMLSRK